MRKLSRLENTVLGLVWRGQPCTAYWVRKQFLDSPSPHFSGSAGTVYPLLRRFEENGLVATEFSARGTRRTCHYELTAHGMEALRDWLLPPIPTDDVAFTVQPLRTRLHYLDALDRAEQLRFVRDALGATRAQLEVVTAEYERRQEAGELFPTLGALGVVREFEARERWLEEVEAELVKPSKQGTRPQAK